MTFESMIDTPAANVAVTTPPPAPAASPLDQALNVENEETLVVKVLYGNDLRRTACVAKYAPLHDVCSKLFSLPPDATVLKYQDEDGDKITMSTDEELNEARALAKDKVLRVIVENKHAAPIPTPPPATPPHGAGAYDQAYAPLYPGLHYAWSHHGGRGGFGPHRGGFRGRGFHHVPPFAHPHAHPHHHAHPHPPHHPHPAPPHMGGQFFPPHSPQSPFEGHPYPPASPVHTTSFEQPQQVDSASVTATFSSARTSNHGVFSPADSPYQPASYCRSARAEASPYYAHCLKERKHAIKEQVKTMKAGCVTEEDRQAFKQLKREMYKELKHERKAFKDQREDERKDKKDKKEKNKKDKKDKKEKKEKKEKREKGDKKEKRTNTLLARHVADVTIPDNSELPADTPVTKTWRLRNSGYIAWPADSQLLFISRRGDDLNGPERVFVGAVEPSQEVEVSVTFVTPTEPGRYIGYYRMATATGKFGQRVWVSFIIPTPAPAPMIDAPLDKSETVEQDTKEVVDVTTEGEQPSAPLDVNME